MFNDEWMFHLNVASEFSQSPNNCKCFLLCCWFVLFSTCQQSACTFNWMLFFMGISLKEHCPQYISTHICTQVTEKSGHFWEVRDESLNTKSMSSKRIALVFMVFSFGMSQIAAVLAGFTCRPSEVIKCPRYSTFKHAKLHFSLIPIILNKESL